MALSEWEALRKTFKHQPEHDTLDKVTITIYDWDTACKCKVIGSVTIAVLSEDETGASWYELDSKFGQVRHDSMKALRLSALLHFATILIIHWNFSTYLQFQKHLVADLLASSFNKSIPRF